MGYGMNIEGRKRYISAIDPIIRRRVLFIVINGWAISLITGHRFKYQPEK